MLQALIDEEHIPLEINDTTGEVNESSFIFPTVRLVGNDCMVKGTRLHENEEMETKLHDIKFCCRELHKLYI